MPALRPLLATLTLATACATQAATLTLQVEPLSGNGELMVAVFDQPAQWLKQPARALRQPLQAGSMRVTLADLPDGDYAITLFVDRNANGVLDRNAMGIPTEPYAFSNDAFGQFGPPSFEQARLTIKGDTQALIRLP
jgi:uncharacterized protein (DUF2141 family)